MIQTGQRQRDHRKKDGIFHQRMFKRAMAILLALVAVVGVNVAIAPAASAVPYPLPLNNYHSGLCVDITGGNATIGEPAIQNTCQIANGLTPTPDQQWMFEPAGGGYYFIENMNRLCLNVKGASFAYGAPVIQWTCVGAANNKWAAVQVNPGAPNPVYNLINYNSGQCLNVKGASTAPGAPLIQWPCTAADNSKWFLSRGTA